MASKESAVKLDENDEDVTGTSEDALDESEYPPNLGIEIVESSNKLLGLSRWLKKRGLLSEAVSVAELRGC